MRPNIPKCCGKSVNGSTPEKWVYPATERQIANFRSNPEVGLAFQSSLGKIANLSSQKTISLV
jgi:hypothetical protein